MRGEMAEVYEVVVRMILWEWREGVTIRGGKSFLSETTENDISFGRIL